MFHVFNSLSSLFETSLMYKTLIQLMKHEAEEVFLVTVNIFMQNFWLLDGVSDCYSISQYYAINQVKLQFWSPDGVGDILQPLPFDICSPRDC